MRVILIKKIYIKIYCIIIIFILLIVVSKEYLEPKKIHIENIKEIEVYTFEGTQKFNGKFIDTINDLDSINVFEEALKESKTKFKFNNSIQANDITNSYGLKIKGKHSNGGFLVFLFLGKNNEESYITLLGYENIYHIPSEKTEELRKILKEAVSK